MEGVFRGVISNANLFLGASLAEALVLAGLMV